MRARSMEGATKEEALTTKSAGAVVSEVAAMVVSEPGFPFLFFWGRGGYGLRAQTP